MWGESGDDEKKKINMYKNIKYKHIKETRQ
jgi:hypothetical protein